MIVSSFLNRYSTLYLCGKDNYPEDVINIILSWFYEIDMPYPEYVSKNKGSTTYKGPSEYNKIEYQGPHILPTHLDNDANLVYPLFSYSSPLVYVFSYIRSTKRSMGIKEGRIKVAYYQGKSRTYFDYHLLLSTRLKDIYSIINQTNNIYDNYSLTELKTLIDAYFLLKKINTGTDLLFIDKVPDLIKAYHYKKRIHAQTLLQKSL